MLFYIQIFSLALSLIAIYACLKWFRNNAKVRYPLWLIALAVDALAYFKFGYTGAGYLGIMLLVCIPFIFKKSSKDNTNT